MLMAALIVLNIPVYLFIGWLAFDSKTNAADTFFDTVTAVLKMILIPYSIRVMFDMDTSGSWGLPAIAGFFIACGAIVYGEYLLILKLFGGG